MKVLVVDDSVIFRSGITQALTGLSDMQVVGTAANGKIALERIKQLSPDVVTLDLEMPEMDGLQTITEIRKTNKNLVIIVFSDQSDYGAKKTLEALALGADDFLSKSVVKNSTDSVEAIRRELVPHLRQFSARVNSAPLPSEKVSSAPASAPVVKKKSSNPELINLKPNLILIGCSTGGPDALRKVFADLKGYKGPPVLVVQHMPPMFTAQLANMLKGICGWNVKEAAEGDIVVDNQCYIAPGDYHMQLKKSGANWVIALNQNEKVQSVRPAADVLFESVAANYPGRVLTIVMTGMGEDGLRGVKKLKEKGARIVIQDKATSVVWGMPGAIANENLDDEIVPLNKIAQFLMEAR